MNQAVTIRYTNHRGETANRRILPHRLKFEATEWHPEPQWFLVAFDLDKQATRDFALADIHSWTPTNLMEQN
jgi:predicted DNA-binding transcriptional regulator YafY